MKEYRVTSQNFVLPGETGDPDAYIDPQELNQLKKLAGIPVYEEYSAGGHSPETGTPNDNDQHAMSPVGSNISVTGQEKRDLEKKHGIRPGTDEWFKLWFSKPYLTGEKPIGDEPAPKIKKR
jgi:hypothetical protein